MFINLKSNGNDDEKVKELDAQLIAPHTKSQSQNNMYIYKSFRESAALLFFFSPQEHHLFSPHENLKHIDTKRNDEREFEQ